MKIFPPLFKMWTPNITEWVKEEILLPFQWSSNIGLYTEGAQGTGLSRSTTVVEGVVCGVTLPTLATRNLQLCEVRPLVKFAVMRRDGHPGSWVFWFSVCSFCHSMAPSITLSLTHLPSSLPHHHPFLLRGLKCGSLEVTYTSDPNGCIMVFTRPLLSASCSWREKDSVWGGCWILVSVYTRAGRWGRQAESCLRERHLWASEGRPSKYLQVGIRGWYSRQVRAQSPGGRGFSPCMCVRGSFPWV